MNKITTQIKLIGLSLSIIAIALVLLTIFLNQKSKHDSNVVNIAGKERMLTQKMAKELFLGMNNKNEFEAAKTEFLSNLNNLIEGSSQNGITPPPTEKIKEKLLLIKQKSDEFLSLSNMFVMDSQDELLKEKIYASNNALLAMIDETVREYTVEFEAKRERLEALQYIGGLLILLATFMSVYLTKKIERKFDKFLVETKEIGSMRCDDAENEDETTSNEGELEQAKYELKNFMAKVEKVVSKAEAALNESKNAIAELESSAKLMENRLASDEIDEKTKKEMELYIDKSEDLTITSLEDIAGTKEMLQKFRNSLAEINKKIG